MLGTHLHSEEISHHDLNVVHAVVDHHELLKHLFLGNIRMIPVKLEFCYESSSLKHADGIQCVRSFL